MAYDEILAERLRTILLGRPGVSAKKMFGGLSFMQNGNLACGVIEDYLIVRVAPEEFDSLMEREYVGPFDFTGRAMKGWVKVSPEGYLDDRDLNGWIERGLSYAATLPAK